MQDLLEMEMEPQEVILLSLVAVLLLLLLMVEVLEAVKEALVQLLLQILQVAPEEAEQDTLLAQLQVLGVPLLADRAMQEVREDTLEARAMVVVEAVLVKLEAIMMILGALNRKEVTAFNIA